MATIFLFLFFASFAALIVGLVKPTAFSRFIKGEITRKKIAAIFGIATVVTFMLVGITADTSKNNQAVQQPVAESSEDFTENENSNQVNVAENQISVKTEDNPALTTTTASVQVKQTENQGTSAATSETVSQKNAIAKAKSYLGYTAFSHDGLVDQLEYEQFSHSDAVYGADNSGANWSEQAAKKAKSYMEYSSFSRGSLIDQLKYDKFTQAQAEYGANAVGL